VQYKNIPLSPSATLHCADCFLVFLDGGVTETTGVLTFTLDLVFFTGVFGTAKSTEGVLF
jgi:hypothetical protein